MSFIDANEENEPVEGSRTLLTVMGDSAVIDGKFKISQSIDIDCEVKGKLNVDGKLTIQRNGLVSADVKTIDAEIIGTYEGNMEASSSVEIKETGAAHGTMKTDSLIINKGGVFSGTVIRISEEEKTSKRSKKSKKGSEEESSEDDYAATSYGTEEGSGSAYGSDTESEEESSEEGLSL